VICVHVVLAANEGASEAASAVLLARGAHGVERRPIGPGRVLVCGQFIEDGDAERVVAALRSEGWPAAARPDGGGHLTAWENHTRPVRVSDRLWVCFPWSEFDRAQAPAVVEIDPDRAFGTGDHPSTRLLLAELADRVRGGEAVLDVGCGSGVLSISAARLGADKVTAIDLRRVAVTTTEANAARNGVGDKLCALHGPLGAVMGTFDVVVANIGAETLVELAADVQSRVASGGWVGLSGLSVAQVSKVVAAFWDLDVVSVPELDDWAAVVLTKH
jgi:ribosomal protein L11 methyltransferase